MKFRNIDIWYHEGRGNINTILDFQKRFNIILPSSYKELMIKYNNPKFEQDSFDFYDSYHKTMSSTSFSFDGFNSQYENIYNQFIYFDKEGYSNVYLFGHTPEGNWICFDYRDFPNSSEPKISLVIHDEYDEDTGKWLIFHVSDNFDQLLDSLYDFNERYPD
ncbi:SMI1/KNR4 family protein [Rodentibacter trehalosifermentans]|uniref:SMI1/KNR4 family protein n=1 Tax=Rodentibacter trehalosifermentans TaxID=1908263 RepID=A0A1V3IVK1_9PAST|nr:SMI1/KNR4 family protein [Rodentibacter trehalosifermentans]OOF45943.1 SMI1/KNR4 family protein [Rodentibacter trehalosifermentans]OOF49821.1 SMI1/KNR4 family protein [Rodentibacter trehalosifermentans]